MLHAGRRERGPERRRVRHRVEDLGRRRDRPGRRLAADHEDRPAREKHGRVVDPRGLERRGRRERAPVRRRAGEAAASAAVAATAGDDEVRERAERRRAREPVHVRTAPALASSSRKTGERRGIALVTAPRAPPERPRRPSTPRAPRVPRRKSRLVALCVARGSRIEQGRARRRNPGAKLRLRERAP